MSRIKLGVNIDHVATLRQARYAEMPDHAQAEPVLLEAAREAVAGGADSLTLHLRADRRHVQDRDVFVVREEMEVPLNLEMGNTEEILEIALRVKPDYVCLVPENRKEITTEGGLDVVGQFEALEGTVRALQGGGARVSMFVDPEIEQVEASKEIGAEMIELHTGSFANVDGVARVVEVEKLKAAALRGDGLGLQINAGHGIHPRNIRDLDAVPHLAEMNIGHHLVSRAVVVGLRRAVEEMRVLMDAYPG